MILCYGSPKWQGQISKCTAKVSTPQEDFPTPNLCPQSSPEYLLSFFFPLKLLSYSSVLSKNYNFMKNTYGLRRKLDLVKQNVAYLIGSFSAKFLESTLHYHFAAYAFAWAHNPITCQFATHMYCAVNEYFQHFSGRKQKSIFSVLCPHYSGNIISIIPVIWRASLCQDNCHSQTYFFLEPLPTALTNYHSIFEHLHLYRMISLSIQFVHAFFSSNRFPNS